MASGVDHGGDDGALRFDEIVDGQIALGHEGAAVVVEFYRKGFGVQPDAVGGRELAVQQLVSAARAPGGKVVISCLDILADDRERDDRQFFHFCRRIDRFSSAIVRVGASPRL